MKRNISDVYSDMDMTCDTFPSDDEVNPKSYMVAADSCKAGDVAVIFTPDDTHFDIALEHVTQLIQSLSCVKKVLEIRIISK